MKYWDIYVLVNCFFFSFFVRSTLGEIISAIYLNQGIFKGSLPDRIFLLKCSGTDYRKQSLVTYAINVFSVFTCKGLLRMFYRRLNFSNWEFLFYFFVELKFCNFKRLNHYYAKVINYPKNCKKINKQKHLLIDYRITRLF